MLVLDETELIQDLAGVDERPGTDPLPGPSCPGEGQGTEHHRVEGIRASESEVDALALLEQLR